MQGIACTPLGRNDAWEAASHKRPTRVIINCSNPSSVTRLLNMSDARKLPALLDFGAGLGEILQRGVANKSYKTTDSPSTSHFLPYNNTSQEIIRTPSLPPAPLDHQRKHSPPRRVQQLTLTRV